MVRVTAPLKGAAQLVLLVPLALAVGNVGLLGMVAEAVLVQPFAAVTVTVSVTAVYALRVLGGGPFYPIKGGPVLGQLEQPV